MVNSSNVEAAVSFLRDSAVQDAPLNKKLEFLQAKGLTQEEIDEAFRIVSSSSSTSASAGRGGPVQLPPRQYPGYAAAAPPFQDQRMMMRPDWRDWFIMAVVGGSVGTLMYSLARKYLLPALKPPSESELTTAQEALTAKYDEAAAILASLQEETTEIKQSLGEQCNKVDEAVGQVGETLESMKEREKERDEEIKNMRDEVDTLKSLIERMFEKHKDAQTESLKDIEQEVKSLKSLLSRRPGGGPGGSGGVESNLSRSASPSQSNLSAAAQAYQPPSGSSAYTSSSSRFGLSSAAGSSTPTGGSLTPSSSFANILNRPPGIPAWQMQPSASSSSIASSTTAPAATVNNSSTSSAAPQQAGEDTTSKSTALSNTDKNDGGYTVDGPQVGNRSDKATTLEESGEIVPSSREVV
ncbi:hypothetical protein P389DRAFT_147859 [Cystobasidium minutum MCA 4210]|uniref:uncharacterized protein n=1 Tax=Cystobasidium minutum MCA 4210 TaxID=1397322 RepID=UPI0034D003F0|eukprot:jgi/Rhomi1/147859/e_gw1.10.15.1